eukprot:scaffold1951_cov258-Pinguiococcus_pyrenoidosus.AAC.13
MAPVVGAWLISAPLREVLKLRRGLVATVNFLPLASIFLSSMVWVLYAYLTSDGMIFVCSAPGVLLGAFYLLSFYSFASDRGHPRIRWISLLTGFYTTAAYALASILEQNRAIGVVGTLGAAISVVLMASPLENIGRVLRDRSAESMNFSLTLAAFLNGALWTLKGTLLQYDPAVWIPNFLGALSGMVQVRFFCAAYGFCCGLAFVSSLIRIPLACSPLSSCRFLPSLARRRKGPGGEANCRRSRTAGATTASNRRLPWNEDGFDAVAL